MWIHYEGQFVCMFPVWLMLVFLDSAIARLAQPKEILYMYYIYSPLWWLGLVSAMMVL